MERRTVSNDIAGVHPGPDHVPRILRQTLPFEYRLGLNLTIPEEVVLMVT